MRRCSLCDRPYGYAQPHALDHLCPPCAGRSNRPDCWICKSDYHNSPDCELAPLFARVRLITLLRLRALQLERAELRSKLKAAIGKLTPEQLAGAALPLFFGAVSSIAAAHGAEVQIQFFDDDDEPTSELDPEVLN